MSDASDTRSRLQSLEALVINDGQNMLEFVINSFVIGPLLRINKLELKRNRGMDK